MGLKCLLGHDFSEPAIEREREEDGSEVVTTVREVKTCQRCGETQVVSENTEVTTVAQLAKVASGADDLAGDGADGRPIDDASPEVGGGSASGPRTAGRPAGTDDTAAGDETPDPGEDGIVVTGSAGANSGGSGSDGGAEILESGPNAAGSGSRNTSGTGSPTAGETATGEGTEDGEGVGGGSSDGDDATAEVANGVQDAVDSADDTQGNEDVGGDEGVGWERDANDDDDTNRDDDGVILDDDGSRGWPDRERGAWLPVESADGPAAEPAPWPDQVGEDEGFSAEVDDGVESGVEFGGGLRPESAIHTDDESEFVEVPDHDDVREEVEDSETRRSGSGTGSTADDSEIIREVRSERELLLAEVETEYFCQTCGMAREADGNSMRAGDICPECKRGYVAERSV